MESRKLCYLFRPRALDSNAYHAAPRPTNIAPAFTPVASLFPNIATLRASEVNLRMLRIIVIVRAVEIALSRFTPRTQTYCVTTLMQRKNMCRGMTRGKGKNSAIKSGMRRGGDRINTLNSRAKRGRNGEKKGTPRKC